MELELYGRRDIYTSVRELTSDNVVAEVNKALSIHFVNVQEMDYLYWYRRGVQPILNREKEVRSDICNKIVENHADEIVAFKNGYFLTQPAYYISRENESAEKVKLLNEYLYRSGKHAADNKVVDWFHTVGKAPIYVEPNNDAECPVKVYALDPRSAFVVYDLTPSHKPVYAVNMAMYDEKSGVADVYTKDRVFRLALGVTAETLTADPKIKGTAYQVLSVEANRLGLIPMVEYRYNSVNMGAFESVLPLLDAINNVMSNRTDGVEQFIQSLAVGVNCQFEDGITYNEIRKAGMIILKSIGENKADFKILSEQLDQSQTQILVDYLYQQVLTICGMPTTTKGGTSTSDTGAAVLYRDGWYQADTVARNTEDLFKESNRYFDELFINILAKKTELKLNLNEFELKFSRNETSNLLVKTQGALNLKQLGLSPEIALAKSGVSNDPVADVANSQKYIEAAWSVEKSTLQDAENTEPREN